MRRAGALLVATALAATLAACAIRRETPMVRYYTLALGPGTSLGGPVRVLAFTTDSPYRDVRIAYRTSPYRLDYYTYHRWAAPPRQLLRALVRDRFDASEDGDGVPIEITGHVRRFEEVDGEDGWSGALTLDLTAARGGARLVDAVYAAEEAAERPDTEAVVEALSRALESILERFAADVRGAARQ